MRHEIVDFTAATGVRLFVKTVAYIDPGITLREVAQQARRELSSEGPAALILVDRGQNGLGISHSPELWQRYPLTSLVETLQGALNDAATDRDAALEDKLFAASRRWMSGVRRLEEERRHAARLLQEPDKPILLGYAALLALGGFGILVFTTRRRAAEMEDAGSLEFPNLAVGQRLGAPYGGGHIVEWHLDEADKAGA